MYVCTYVQVYTHVVYVHVEARCLPRVLFSLCFLRQAPIGAGTCQLGWIPGQQALGPSCLGYSLPPPQSHVITAGIGVGEPSPGSLTESPAPRFIS